SDLRRARARRGRASFRREAAPPGVVPLPRPPRHGAAPRSRGVIRLAREDDWPSILEVHRTAFGDDDVPRLAPELHARPDLHVREFSCGGEEEGVVGGPVMTTWNGIGEREGRALQLSPLGVLPAHQRRGHGSELVRTSLDAVRAAAEPLLLVQGDPAYYG